ncbi:MAG: exosortase C-terminal domain/associated protein EpsI [Longimicrobiales bacterium]
MKWLRWAPAGVLALGRLLSLGLRPQLEMPLRMALSEAVPRQIAAYRGTDHEMTAVDRQTAGVTNYLVRTYQTPQAESATPAFSVYAGYYDRQTRDQTIHSPKNCLPGSGWEALASSTARVTTSLGVVTVNRYLVQRGEQRALVLYWYQGRGRIEFNEYKVKAHLLQDAAFRRRSEEALLRIVVPFKDSELSALGLATAIAAELVPAIDRVLPE